MLRIDLAEYELSERLGTGTVGTIFLAKHKSTRDLFAVKFLSPGVSSNDLVVSRFHREMLILGKLDHPNILAYHGGGRQDNQLFYVMEYIRGGTLKDLLVKSGPLTWRETAESARQISAALQHAHNHGIIHRDLKPGNVFITESGELKLGDFGIARDTRATDLTETGLTVGTYSYMAPELIKGERGVTGLVDLYALGCLMFELLTEKPPYLGDNFAQIFDQHLKSIPPSVAAMGIECPPKIDHLIQQLLAKNPEDRPFNARSVQGILNVELNPSASAKDVGEEPSTIRISDFDTNAADVNPAKQMLSDRVTDQLGQREEVSWSRLGWCMALIVGVIVAASVLSR